MESRKSKDVAIGGRTVISSSLLTWAGLKKKSNRCSQILKKDWERKRSSNPAQMSFLQTPLATGSNTKYNQKKDRNSRKHHSAEFGRVSKTIYRFDEIEKGRS